MDHLLAARSQMAMSLGFHIVFAAIGMAMPLLMAIAEGLWLFTGEPVYRVLAKRWAKGTAMLFAVGAVSGTVLSFELGLLWPGFMRFAGPIIGMPFSLEGFAFFLEAIFLGIYVYGWDRVPRLTHWLAGVGVLLSGLASGAFVLCANGWMNTPAGYTLDANGALLAVDPFAAMFNPSAFAEGLHMTSAAFLAVGMLVAGIHAYALRHEPNNLFHRRALAIALTVGGLAALVQPATGHVAAETVARNQPVKLAAMEAAWETERGAPFRIGGIPDAAAEVTSWAIEVPGLLSFLAYGDVDAEVKGLKAFPKADRPPVSVVHYAFQVMLASGAITAGVAGIGLLLAIRRRAVPTDRWFLGLLVLQAPAGLIGIEAGWVVTEVGRQPWVIQGVMRTADAVTPTPGLEVHFLAFSLLYLLLGLVVVGLMRRIVAHAPHLDADGREVAP